LVRPPIPIVWEEPEEAPTPPLTEDGAEDAVVTH
jgi:hypothetical protein